MSSVYCPECGSPTEYKYDKPKFCGACGSSMNGFSAKPTPQKVVKASAPLRRPAPRQEEDQDEEEYRPLPEISELEFEVTGTAANGNKLSSLLGTRDPATIEASTGARQPIDKKAMLDDFRREAGFGPRSQPQDIE